MTETASPSDTTADEPAGPESDSGIRYRLLGPVEVVHKGVVRAVPSGRQQALLAALLLRAGEVVSAPTLMEQVWDGTADRSVLNMCVMRLRRTLRDDDRDLVRAEGNGYRVAVDPETVDLHRFRRLCVRAGEHRDAGDRDRERDLLRQALALWRGEALAGIVSPMLQSEVVPILEEERLAAIEHRIGADLECGSHTEVIRELRQLVADHPFRERFWCQLLLALYRSGRQADALHTYQMARRRLTEELGVEPGEELRELHRRVLASDLTLREGRLAVEPVPRVVPAQLPAAVASFSGRADQLRQLDRLLDNGEPEPATLIIGSPGVGKTALAVYWASRHRERWPDGQLYIDLRGYGPEAAARPIEALAYFLRAIGLPAERVPTQLAEASALFRSLINDRKLLIMLDNASAAEQVRPLLPGGTTCTVIVTSRDRLTGLVVKDGARLLPLDVLADAEAKSLLADAVGDTRLAAEPDGLGELAKLCGNLPLALRITAADLSGHPERSLARHLEGLRTGNRLDALQVPDDDETAVRAAFRSSYARLPEPVRRLFRLLGLFPGPEVGPESAAALAGAEPEAARRLLDRLVSAHLVISRGPDRFVLHDLLRLFATELAHEVDSEAVRDEAVQRIYDYYTRIVDAAVERLYPSTLRLPLSAAAARVPVPFDDDATALDWLGIELPNLVAAVGHAAEYGKHLDAGRLSASLHGYFYSKLHFVEWLSVVRAGLSAARAIGHPRAQVTAHMNLGALHRYQSHRRTAIKHYQRALLLSRHDDWIEGQICAHNDLSGVHDVNGDLRPTAVHLNRALELSRTIGSTMDEAIVLGNLSRVLLQMGQVTDAIAHLERSLGIHNRLGSRVSAARTLASLGDALRVHGELDRARTMLLRATAQQRELDDRQFLPNSLGRTAHVYIEDGEYARAGELATTALALTRKTGNNRAETGLILIFAEIDARSGRFATALDHYRGACRQARELGQGLYQVRSLIGLGTVHRELGQEKQARHHLDKAIAMSRRFGYRLLEEQALAELP